MSAIHTLTKGMNRIFISIRQIKEQIMMLKNICLQSEIIASKYAFNQKPIVYGTQITANSGPQYLELIPRNCISFHSFCCLFHVCFRFVEHDTPCKQTYFNWRNNITYNSFGPCEVRKMVSLRNPRKKWISKSKSNTSQPSKSILLMWNVL